MNRRFWGGIRLFFSGRFWLSLAVLLALMFIQLQNPVYRQAIRNIAFDQWQRLAPRACPEEIPVRVVAIDEASLKEIGQWPWPRPLIGSLVDRLTGMGASVLAFDLVFFEPDRTSPPRLAALWPDRPELAEQLRQMPDHDQILADSFRNSHVVTGIVINAERNGHPPPQVKAGFLSFGPPMLPLLPARIAATPNIAVLEQAAEGNGVISIPPDVDGVIRRLPLVFRLNDQLYPAMGLEAVRLFLGLSQVMVQVVPPEAAVLADATARIQSLTLAGAVRPTSPAGEVWLHYRPLQPDRYLSAADVLKGTVDSRQIADHLVIIGSTAHGLGDHAYSPIGEIVPGVEVHLQLMEQLLAGDYLRQPEWIDDFILLLLLSFWLVLLLMLRHWHPVWSVFMALSVIGGVFYQSWSWFVRDHLFFDPLYPTLAMIALFLSLVIPKYFQSVHEQRWIYSAFSRYVSPNRVKFLQENPDQLKLGGEYRTCSFVMTDLAGFTTLMENHEPATLVSVLNRYLDNMIGIAFKHEGTVDRIVGDAVAVMFSTPLIQADHAARAIACAADMDRFALQFSQELSQQGIPLGITRIGVHTGQVLVGNFGGEVMLDYRALGDPINTASRLESVNKFLGTRLCVSEAAVRQTPDFIGRPVAALVLKGKTQAVQVFEPLSQEEDQSPRIVAYRKGYALLQEESPQALPTFAQLAQVYPEDPVIGLHKRRLEAGEVGIQIVMATK